MSLKSSIIFYLYLSLPTAYLLLGSFSIQNKEYFKISICLEYSLPWYSLEWLPLFTFLALVKNTLKETFFDLHIAYERVPFSPYFLSQLFRTRKRTNIRIIYQMTLFFRGGRSAYQEQARDIGEARREAQDTVSSLPFHLLAHRASQPLPGTRRSTCMW